MFRFVAAVAAIVFVSLSASADGLSDAVRKEYDNYLSPLFRIEPEPSVRAGVESTVVALMELMPAD